MPPEPPRRADDFNSVTCLSSLNLATVRRLGDFDAAFRGKRLPAPILF